MRTAMLVEILIISLYGCETPPQAFTPPPVEHAECASLPKTETGIVRGQVFAKTVGGDIKKGAGNEVFLIPATTHEDQRSSNSLISGKSVSTVQDVKHVKYDEMKTADGDGRFEFADVAVGSYYVLSNITWETVSDNTYSRQFGLLETQGGLVVRKINVSKGTVTEAMLVQTDY